MASGAPLSSGSGWQKCRVRIQTRHARDTISAVLKVGPRRTGTREAECGLLRRNEGEGKLLCTVGRDRLLQALSDSERDAVSLLTPLLDTLVALAQPLPATARFRIRGSRMRWGV